MLTCPKCLKGYDLARGSICKTCKVKLRKFYTSADTHVSILMAVNLARAKPNLPPHEVARMIVALLQTT